MSNRDWKDQNILSSASHQEEVIPEESLTSFFTTAPAGLAIMDSQLRYVQINETLARMNGLPAQAHLGKTISEIIPEYAPIFEPFLQKVITTGESVLYTMTTGDNPLAPGDTRHWTNSFFPVLGLHGKTQGVGVIVVETTELQRVEIAFRKSEAHFRRLVETSQEGIWTIDTEANTAYVNRQLTEMLGCTAEDMLGRSAFEFLTKEDYDKGRELLKRCRRGHKWKEDFRLRRKDGREIWVTLASTPIIDEQGQIEGGLAMLTDVTERKLAEQEREEMLVQLEAERARLEVILRQMPAGFAMVEAPRGRLLLGNKQMEEIFRHPIIPAANIQQYSVYKGFHPDGRPYEPQEWPVARSIAKGEIVEGEEIEIQRGDGTRGVIRSSAAPVRDHEGRITAGIVTFYDITAAKEAEERLRKSELLLAEAQKIAHIGSWEWDLVTNTATWSDEHYRLFGLSPQAKPVTYESFLEMLHPEDRTTVAEHIQTALQQGSSFSFNYRILTPAGATRICHSRGKVICNTVGQVVKLIGTAQDITERVQLEEQFRQAQKLEAVGRLAGGVAHDFNNMLTAILGYSDFLLMALGPENNLAGYVEEIKKAGERAAALTRQLLAFSRRQMLQPKVVDLNAIISDLQKMLRRVIGEDIDLIADLEEYLGKVKVDPGQIEQVIMNLAVNARDAMPQGGKLIIKTANIDLDDSYGRQKTVDVQPGPYVLLAITDTGEGMDEVTKAHIFEPFFTTKEQGKGSGLGLSTVYGIISQSGGYVFVDSEPAHGATFKIYLPRLAADAVPTTTKATVSALSGRETILIVEDEEVLRGMAQTVLIKRGYHVLEAANGEEALELCQRYLDPIHLVLTDVVMPHLGGRELAQQLMVLRPEIKVLYMSGYTNDEVVHSGLLDQGKELLAKPFTPVELVQKVREILEQLE